MKHRTLRVLATVVLALIFVALAVQRGATQASAARPLDATAAIPYFIANPAGTIGFRDADRQLARWALDAWQRSSQQRLRFEAAAVESDALIRLFWADPAGGLYGEMRPLEVGGRRGAAVFIRAAELPDDPLLRDSIVYLTCLHELGHALGLEHTRDFRDIMYFFGYGGSSAEYFGRYRANLRVREDIATASGLSEGDVTRLRAIYAAAR